MKKLMTMIAAVATAFGLYAGALDNTVDFSSAADQNPYVPGDSLWAYTANDEATEILEGEVQVKDHALVLKTGAKVLSRMFAAEAYEIPAEGNLYADMVLNFNNEILDEVPEIDAGTKIALFAMGGEDAVAVGLPAQTNVYVYAAYGTDGGKALFALRNDGETFIGSARCLAIKAYETVEGEGGRSGFLLSAADATVGGIDVVEVDAVYTFNDSTKKWSDVQLSGTAGDYLGGITVDGKFGKWIAADQRSLFVSIANDMNNGALASVDFKGNAALMSIALTDEMTGWPLDSVAMKLEITDATITDLLPTTYTVSGDSIVGPVEGEISFKVSTTKQKVTVKLDGVEKTPDGDVYTVAMSEDSTLTVKGWDAVATVKVGEGEAIPCETIDEAIGAANTAAASAPVTLKLAGDVNSGTTELGGTNKVTFDLNGKKFTLSEDEQISACGILEITDSSDAKTGRIIGIADVGSGTLTITGGSFDKDNNTDDNDKFYLENNVADGFVVGEKTIEEVDFWTVKEAEKGTVIFVCEKTGLNATNKYDVGTVVNKAAFPAIDKDGIYTATWDKDSVEVSDVEQTVTATAAIVFVGSGTEATPYEIATVTDLKKLDAFTRDGLAVAGVYFKQTDNIDLEGAVFNGIGARDKDNYKYNQRTKVTAATDIFRGVYDGNGKMISNITGDNTLTGKETAKYGGVFNTIQGATIKNLTVKNIALVNSETGDSAYGIVGVAYDATLTGLKTMGTITVNGNYGAIANSADNTVFTDCENAAAVTNYNNDHLTQGGMVCYGTGVQFIRCKNTGVLYAVEQISSGNPREGGIIGADCAGQSTAIVFEDCVVAAGTVTGAPATDGQQIHMGSLMGDAQGQAAAGLVVKGTNIVPNNLPTIGESSAAATKVFANEIAYATAGEDNTFVIAPIAVGETYKVVAPVHAGTTNTLFTAAGQTLTLDDTFVTGGLFEGGFAAADDSLVVEQTGTKGGTITFTAKAVSTDPIPVIDPAQPGAGEKIAEVTAKFVNDSAVAKNVGVENYTAFQAWAAKCTSGQEAVVVSSDAFLSFALNAADVPAEAITDDDVTIDSYDAATGKITVSIEGIVPGAAVPAGELAKVLTAIGGEALDAMDTAKVTASGVSVASGVIEVTVTPKAENPAAFFTQVKLVK